MGNQKSMFDGKHGDNPMQAAMRQKYEITFNNPTGLTTRSGLDQQSSECRQYLDVKNTLKNALSPGYLEDANNVQILDQVLTQLINRQTKMTVEIHGLLFGVLKQLYGKRALSTKINMCLNLTIVEG